MKSYLICLFLLLNIPLLSLAQYRDLKWEVVAPGVWKSVIGNPDKVTPLSIAQASPQTGALNKLTNLPFPEALRASSGEISNNKTFLRFPLQQNEDLFGLGLNFKALQQRRAVKYLHMDHYGIQDNGRSHAPVPFYVSDKGYGVLINSARYITVYAGTTVRKDSKNPPPEMNRNTQADWNSEPTSDAVEVLVPAAGTEIYVFAGSSIMEVVQRYNLFCGGGTLPPKWGLGFTHRTPSLYTAEDVLKEAADFEQHGFPLSFIGLESGWETTAYPNSFAWDAKRFPQPKQFVQSLLQKNIRVNLWINPYVSSGAPIAKQMEPYTGSHKVWMGSVPDILMPQARDIYKTFFKSEHLDIGVSGYKIDEVDGYDNWLWPDVAQFPSGTSAEQMRQVYGLQFQKMSDQWFHEMNTRTYGLVRASNAGGASFPYVIYNDYYDHKDFITALCSSSFIGVLWTPEARSSATSEEWLRRIQSVCFSPMAMINAWNDGTKPWSFPDVETQVKEAMQLRMQLLPYLYTTFAQYHFEGKPPVRAMKLAEGFDFKDEEEKGVLSSTDNPYAVAKKQDVKDQFMLGDYLLVAPMFTGETKRKVILPKGKWFDFYTGKLAGESEVIEITPGLDHIPLFVKDGGMIPMIPPLLHSPKKEDILPLTIRVYGSKASTWKLYDDDGETYNFEKGDYKWTTLEVKKDNKGQLKGFVSPSNLAGTHYKNVQWQYMTAL